MGVFSRFFLLVFLGLLAIHWSYGTCHMNETSTHFKSKLQKCSTPEVYPILSPNTIAAEMITQLIPTTFICVKLCEIFN